MNANDPHWLRAEIAKFRLHRNDILDGCLRRDRLPTEFERFVLGTLRDLVRDYSERVDSLQHSRCQPNPHIKTTPLQIGRIERAKKAVSKSGTSDKPEFAREYTQRKERYVPPIRWRDMGSAAPEPCRYEVKDAHNGECSYTPKFTDEINHMAAGMSTWHPWRVRARSRRYEGMERKCRR